jgi:kynurenine formamidase
MLEKRMRSRRFLLLLPVVAACASVPHVGADLVNSTVVDPTYQFDSTTLYWPNSPSGFQLKELAKGVTPGGYYYSANLFTAPEHGGTHIDAPIHFSVVGPTVDRIPVRQLIAPAVVIDITSHAASNADYRLTAQDVRTWEATHQMIPQGAIVLLRTGWGKFYGNRKAYFGDDTPGATDKLHFPSYGADAARLLVEERHVGAIGVDTPSIDYGQSSDFIVHQISAKAGVPGLENIANLESVPSRGAWVIALPMKIGGGSGGPLRIVALVPR